jgi:hypothetical protein
VCIEHKTLIRICLFEVKKSADDMTEADWRSYFLEANASNTSEYSAVELSMKIIKMDNPIKDAKSLVMKLISDF